MNITKISENDIEMLHKAISMNETLFKRFQQQWDKANDEFGLLQKAALDNSGAVTWPFALSLISKEEREQTKNPYALEVEIEPSFEVKATSTHLKIFVNKPAGLIVGIITHMLPIPMKDIGFILRPRTTDPVGLKFDAVGRYENIHDIPSLVDAILADLFFVDIPELGS